MVVVDTNIVLDGKVYLGATAELKENEFYEAKRKIERVNTYLYKPDKKCVDTLKRLNMIREYKRLVGTAEIKTIEECERGNEEACSEIRNKLDIRISELDDKTRLKVLKNLNSDVDCRLIAFAKIKNMAFITRDKPAYKSCLASYSDKKCILEE